jgi:hypothetical protein
MVCCSILGILTAMAIHVARVWPPRKRDFLKAKAVGGAMAH